MKNSFKTIHECLVKIESFFNNIVFKNFKVHNSLQTLNTESGNLVSCRTEIVDLNTKRNADVSLTISSEVLNMESYRSAQLSDFMKNLNIGNLVPLKCGHNGVYSGNESEMYSLYLLNSKFIT